MNVSSTVLEIENWELENEKNRGFGIPKLGKTGIIEKKKSSVAC